MASRHATNDSPCRTPDIRRQDLASQGAHPQRQARPGLIRAASALAANSNGETLTWLRGSYARRTGPQELRLARAVWRGALHFACTDSAYILAELAENREQLSYLWLETELRRRPTCWEQALALVIWREAADLAGVRRVA